MRIARQASCDDAELMGKLFWRMAGDEALFNFGAGLRVSWPR
jgi:hypothetical protein